jgi:hypothetical protein
MSHPLRCFHRCRSYTHSSAGAGRVGAGPGRRFASASTGREPGFRPRRGEEGKPQYYAVGELNQLLLVGCRRGRVRRGPTAANSVETRLTSHRRIRSSTLGASLATVGCIAVRSQLPNPGCSGLSRTPAGAIPLAWRLVGTGLWTRKSGSVQAASRREMVRDALKHAAAPPREYE